MAEGGRHEGEQGQPLVTADELDLSSSTPLYRQLAELLRTRIATQQLHDGDRLPTEQALSRDLGIGVSTVRGAYALLVDEGLVVRRAGRGSFVSHPKLSRQLRSLYNFTEEIRALGMEPSSRVLAFRVGKPSVEAADELGISPTDDTYVIRRVRCADGRPVLLETSTVPVRLCPGLTEADVEGSLYESMTRLMGCAPASAREVHEATTLTEEQARILGRTPGMAAFRISRVTVNARGEACEHSLAAAPGDQTRYIVELDANGSTTRKAFMVQGA